MVAEVIARGDAATKLSGSNGISVQKSTSAKSSSSTKQRITMRIHGKWYDVTDFNHPGGPIMLSLGDGRDATALFEAHHPFTSRPKLERILSKYETSEHDPLLDENDKNEFEWPEADSKQQGFREEAPVGEFFRELREKVRIYFNKQAQARGVTFQQATKATPARWFELTLLFLMFAVTVPSFVRGELWTLFVTPFVYWVWGVNFFHDGSHFALSTNWVVNAAATYVGWWFSSPMEWYHQHVIGHHAYTNIPNRDPDLYHNAQMERHTTSLRWKPLHSHQGWTWAPIWWIGTYALNYIKPLQMFLTGHYNRAVPMMRMSRQRAIIHWFGRAFVYFLCHVWPFLVMPWQRAILFATVPIGIVSMCFMLSSQVNHLTVETVDKSSKDYYIHQVITSHAFGRDSKFTFLFTGGLNCQISHHLFPTVNHCHLPHIETIVEDVCKKHGVHYPYTRNIWQAFLKYIEHMNDLSTP